MKNFRSLRESHYPTQGSSVEYPPYKEMDMKNLVKDAIGDMAEDDGPHTSDIPDMPNFTPVANPEDVINQPSSEGNRDATGGVASRKTGKPFKTLRKKMSYGGEDFSGAVASVAIGEAVKDAADKGEYDYEGDMAKSSLRTIVRNAQMMHDMLKEDENLPEWVASKITLAEDYIVTAAQYMQSEMNENLVTVGLMRHALNRAAPPKLSPSSQRELDRAKERIKQAQKDAPKKKSLLSRIKDRLLKRKNEQLELDEISRFKEREIAHELRHEDEYERKHKRPYVAPARRPVAQPHSVHIGGKKWKSFGSHAHASAVAKKLEAKGKKATVHKDD